MQLDGSSIGAPLHLPGHSLTITSTAPHPQQKVLKPPVMPPYNNGQNSSSLSRKRSATILQASPSPPSSRPPSRDGDLNVDHKRSRVAKQWTACPEYVTTAESSIRLDQRAEHAIVNVLHPGLNGLSDDGGFAELVSGNCRFTMLCFLGCTIDHLHAASVVSALLSTFKVNVFGVSLIPPPPHTSSLPIIYDGTRQLSSSLGLLHPLGGGRQALDAIVVLDSKLRRRMLLPIGWGVKPQRQQRSARNVGLANTYADSEEEEMMLTSEQEVERAVKRMIAGIEWLIHEETEEYSRTWDEGIRTATVVHGMDYS
ncbi:hypothetical protein H072_1522 [Dactylellina haptotyla CBS 200.50]|uniref:Uncharacterized protein n=1 Tax=Dactylellina haptotyla (strain CBS 200.50) TaxID=1284197 RepID=S8AU49_DACHA|nr:hypothetical protein H072_1522 [Dactylellina haptotyla CBS 200.50]